MVRRVASDGLGWPRTSGVQLGLRFPRMTSRDEEYNPFEAPKVTETHELQLRAGQDLLVTRWYIVCRETVELPKICIRYGETGDMAPRHKKLRTLAPSAILKIVVAAIMGFAALIWHSNFSNSASAAASGIVFLCLFAGLAFVVWRATREGYLAVDATWYISTRYRRRIFWSRVIVGLAIFFAFTGLGGWLSWELNSLWPLGMFLIAAAAIGAGYDPEERLRLRGRRKNVFLLQGHSKKFHQAWLRHVSDAE